MSVTKTLDANMNLNPSADSYMARGGMHEIGTITMDSAYLIGGEAITFPHFRSNPKLVQLESEGGYSFEYDRTNNKIKAFTAGKSLIVEEVVTVASHVGTLKHRPFYILAIDVTATTTTGPYNAIPTGETPLTTECAVDFPTGGLTFVSSDLVTSVRVTYIPLHETGPFSSDNLVIDEAVVASASKTDLAFQAAAVQYVYDGTDGNRMLLESVGLAPSAAKSVVIDIDDGSDDTNIDAHATDAGTILKVTYIKYGTFKPYAQLGDGDLTMASEIYNFTVNNYRSLAIPGLGTQLVAETNASGATVELIWSGPSISVGAGVPVLGIELNLWSTNESTALTDFTMPIIFLNSDEIPAARLEVGTGVDLSGLPIRYVAFGY